MTALQEAGEVRATLQQKRDNVALQLVALDEARKEIAFEAHTGNAEAEKRLAKMNRDRLALLGDIENLETGVAESERRIGDAERNEEMAAGSQRAERALSIAAELIDHASKIDELPLPRNLKLWI